MPWCPKCKMEYPDKSRPCALCGWPLIDHEPEPIKAPGQPQPENIFIQTILIWVTVICIVLIMEGIIPITSGPHCYEIIVFMFYTLVIILLAFAVGFLFNNTFSTPSVVIGWLSVAAIPFILFMNIPDYQRTAGDIIRAAFLMFSPAIGAAFAMMCGVKYGHTKHRIYFVYLGCLLIVASILGIFYV